LPAATVRNETPSVIQASVVVVVIVDVAAAASTHIPAIVADCYNDTSASLNYSLATQKYQQVTVAASQSDSLLSPTTTKQWLSLTARSLVLVGLMIGQRKHGAVFISNLMFW
jgi:hypothetical protein